MRRSAGRMLTRLVVSVLATALVACAPVRSMNTASIPGGDAFGVIAQTLLDSAASKYRRVAPSYDPGKGYPHSTRADGTWSTVPVSDWTSGFFPGTLWYLHDYTLDPVLRAQAERFTLPIAAVESNAYEHDLGVRFSSSFGNAYRVTRDERFRERLLDAARHLANDDRRAGATRSWNASDRNVPALLETTMNLEPLLWGASHGGDTAWREVARRRGLATLASADSATRARDQAFGLYGYTLLYRETRDARFLSAARRLAGNALERLPDDFVPCIDLKAPVCPDRAQRDASAAAIMASALLELSTFVRGDDSVSYRTTAEQMLESLASPGYLAPNGNAALLLHSVGDRSEMDVGIVYADYYLVEALLRYLQLSGQSGVRVLDAR